MRSICIPETPSPGHFGLAKVNEDLEATKSDNYPQLSFDSINLNKQKLVFVHGTRRL